MPERGRPAASSGNAYHDVRVAICLIDLLDSVTVTSVAVETLDEIDDVVVQCSDGTTRYEQVKQRAPSGRWTAQRLTRASSDSFFASIELIPTASSSCLPDLMRPTFVKSWNAHGTRPPIIPTTRQVAKPPQPNGNGASRVGAVSSTRFSSRIPTVDGEHGEHTVTWQDLHAVLARVQVLDAQGTIDQLRDRSAQRLRPLVDDPARALDTLERLARNAATRRSVIQRSDVETALTGDGSGPRFEAFTFAFNADAYADQVQRESAAVDIAQLPPLVPQFDSPSGLSFDLDTVRGTTLLVGGHGAGKSRIAAELAVRSIRSGRPCLHVRLARWATTLRDLLVAELSRAAARHARSADVDRLFHDAAVLVLDGLDEVPTTQRLLAEREVLQFADSHPHLDVLVTCRPGSGRTLSQEWPALELRPLSHEQIATALGRNPHTLGLPGPILALAGNPLMLGLLVRRLASGGTPTSEAELLDAFIAEIVHRESRRIPSIDGTSGHRLAEDAAFEWLSSGRIALDQDQFRSMAALVAMNLRRLNLAVAARNQQDWGAGLGYEYR